MKMLLASQSPRRREILQNLGISFEIVPIDVEEIYPENLPAEEVAAYLSRLKAEAFRDPAPGEVLLTADTVVVLEGEVLGKPKDAADAVRMVLALSGKLHTVYTAFTVRCLQGFKTVTDSTEVCFAEISRAEAEFYVEECKPLDKAGSYGVQDWLGMAKIRAMKGSFYTVMGLPAHLVYENLKEIGFDMV